MIFEEYNEQKAMEAAKEHAEKRFNEGVEQGIEQGIERGTSKEKSATVKRMAKKNMPLSDIAECTDLSIDEVQKILNTIAK